MLLYIAISFLFSSFFLLLFRCFAEKIGLIDKPSERKKHLGTIPLVGGVSIYCSFLLGYWFFGIPLLTTTIFFVCAGILTFLGALDDRFDISYKLRLFIQMLISVVMIAFVNMHLTHLGTIWGDLDIRLPTIAGYLFTIIAVIGSINAFNMIDGIDGLLGVLSSITLAALAYIFYRADDSQFMMLSVIFISALLPYILLNLGFPFKQRFKVFMGDAGSMLIGFTVVWLLAQATQASSTPPAMRPVTALWFIAIPLMDMATIMIRRICRGDSPFKPDREHLHHICQNVGFSSRGTLIFISLLSMGFAVIGIIGEIFAISETVMFVMFILLFAAYFNVVKVCSRRVSMADSLR